IRDKLVTGVQTCALPILNRTHISPGLISVPVSSVIVWMDRENSICSRRGRSNPCSAFITYATPPLPDWLLTRITLVVAPHVLGRSEERRVGKECRAGGLP